MLHSRRKEKKKKYWKQDRKNYMRNIRKEEEKIKLTQKKIEKGRENQ